MLFKNNKISTSNNFDFLRFLFALIVVAAHSVTLSQSSALLPLLPYFDSYLAICGFFVISGFLVTKSFMSSDNLKIYFSKRIRRVLPAYSLVVILCVLLLSFISSLNWTEYFSSSDTLKYFLSNIVFLNFLHPELPGVFADNYLSAVNGALWTIKVEVGFYILLPLIILLSGKIKSAKRAFVFLILLYFSSIIFRQGLIHYGEKLENDLIIMLSRQIPGFLSYFLSGSLLFIFIDRFLKNKNLWLIAALVVYLTEWYLGWEVFRPFALACIVIYFAFGFSFLNRFGKYGDISYGIYIFHFPIIQVMVYYGFYDKQPWLFFFLTIFLVCTIGMLSWHLIEKRFLSAKRRNMHQK